MNDAIDRGFNSRVPETTTRRHIHFSVSAFPVNVFLIDGHVHVHPAYDERVFLEAAHANLSKHGTGQPTLLLAEMQGVNVFAKWRSGNAPWTVTLTDESCSLFLNRECETNIQHSTFNIQRRTDDGEHPRSNIQHPTPRVSSRGSSPSPHRSGEGESGATLLIIAGRQIITAEKIEVLAQCTSELFPDGLPLDETIERAKATGALVVLPWGVGKWFGARGRLVAQAVERHDVLLGDNAGRPIGWPSPALFSRRAVLPGSDPLRLKSEERVVGTFGFRFSCEWDARRPAASLAAELRRMTGSPACIGRRAAPLAFVRQQTGLRLTRKSVAP